jgi:hypothetical protein
MGQNLLERGIVTTLDETTRGHINTLKMISIAILPLLEYDKGGAVQFAQRDERNIPKHSVQTQRRADGH